jgi:hypothetical protein
VNSNRSECEILECETCNCEIFECESCRQSVPASFTLVPAVAGRHPEWRSAAGALALGPGCEVAYCPECAAKERRCRVCGCTHHYACPGSSGCGCAWAGPDLCTECVGKEAAQELTPAAGPVVNQGPSRVISSIPGQEAGRQEKGQLGHGAGSGQACPSCGRPHEFVAGCYWFPPLATLEASK